MSTEVDLDVGEAVADIEDAKLSLPSRNELARAIRRGIRKTADQLADALNRAAPRSDPDEYDPGRGDHPPETPLSESFYSRSVADSPFAHEVITSEDDRAFLLDVGENSGEFITPDDGGVLAFEDENGDLIFREYVERGPIDGQNYIEPTFQRFKQSRRLERNIRNEIDELID